MVDVELIARPPVNDDDFCGTPSASACDAPILAPKVD